MIIHYVLVISAALMFSLQFFFNQGYQKASGKGLSQSLNFTAYTSILTIFIMLVLGGFKVQISSLVIMLSCINAINSILYSYAAIRAFEKANLSVFSVFAMLGGMILPFLYGVIFNNEPMSWTKGACVVLIILALAITIKGEKNIGRGVIFYIIVFISNGMGGVLSTIHQNSANPVSSESYMIWKSVITVIMCAIIMFIVYKKINFESWKAIKFTLGYGLFYGVGNLFLLISLVHLSASVQYPLITGGTMVFSTIISIVRREKLTATTIISAVLALGASIVIAL